jgi:hypothetical protein
VEHGSWAAPQPLWQELYEAGADIVLAGHDHLYERFAPQTPTGEADPAFGLRQFVVGTGGSSGYGFGTPAPNSEVRSSGTPGVLKLTLKRETYQWEFVPIAGAAFRDSGSGSCHGAPPAQTSSVILSAAGNIGDCGGTDDDATGRLLDDIPGTILALGDNAFDNGTLYEYQRCYGDAWGRHKARTYAVLGNHEYQLGNASGAFDYFGDRVGPRDLGYYSFDIGAWHVIVLNDNDPPVSLAGGSAQDQWLAADLASHGNLCLLAAWHAPAFLSSNSAGFTTRDRRQLWERLYSAGVDVVLNSQQHHYERMAPLRPDGTRDDATGIRQFNVGTGGESVLLPTVAIHPASEVRAARFGVLKLTLTSTGYGWDFVATGGGFVDSGSGSCH